MLKSREVVVLSMTLLGIPACGGMERGGSTGGAGTTSTQASFDDLSSFSLEGINGLSLSGGRVSIKGSSGATLLILTSGNTASKDSTVQIAAEGMPALTVDSLALAVDPSDDPPEAAFHEYLREVEIFAAESEDPILRSSSAFSALTQEPQTGSTRTFKVLSTMTSTAQYKSVKGTLRVTTPNLFIYVDAEAPSAIGDEDLETLADQFEEKAIPLERELFGTESDINGDGRITILMSCVTNGMSSSGGIVTGFFFPGDLFKVSSSNPASNEMEIFYTLVPDPKGKCGVPISHEFALDNILPGVLAHEYQHMISFNNHVLEGGGSTESPWLNEGLSHLAEDLTGFGNENPSRVQLFLTRPSTTPLVPPTAPRLAERGAAYLFLRYLYEQHPNGDQFVQKLLDGTETGVENVVRAFGGADSSFDEFSEMVQNWSVALALSDTGLSSSARYNYRARSIHPETGNYTGICLRCRTDDGRGTELAGPAMVRVSGYPLTTSLTASASNFFLLTDPPSDILIQSAGDPELKGSVLKLKP